MLKFVSVTEVWDSSNWDVWRVCFIPPWYAVDVPTPCGLRGVSTLLQKAHLFPCTWELCSSTGAHWGLTHSSFTLFLSLCGWRALTGACSFSIYLPGSPKGMLRETLPEEWPVAVCVCSNDVIKDLLLVLKANAWWNLTTGSAGQAITALCCCELAPGKQREKGYLGVCIMTRVGSDHLSMWSTWSIFHTVLVKALDPEWLGSWLYR